MSMLLCPLAFNPKATAAARGVVAGLVNRRRVGMGVSYLFALGVIFLLPLVLPVPSGAVAEGAEADDKVSYWDLSYDEKGISLETVQKRLAWVGIRLPVQLIGNVDVNLAGGIPWNSLRNAQAYRGNGTVSAAWVQIGGVTILRPAIRLDYTNGLARLSLLEGELVHGPFDPNAPLPPRPPLANGQLAPGSFSGKAEWMLVPMGDFRGNLRVNEVTLPPELEVVIQYLGDNILSGELAVTLEMGGSTPSFSITNNRGSLVGTDLRIGAWKFPILDVRWNRTPTQWAFEQLRIKLKSGQIVGQGTIPLAKNVKGPVELVWENVRLEELLEHYPGTEIVVAGEGKGSLKAALEQTAKGWDVAAEGDVNFGQVMWGRRVLATTADAQFTWNDRKLDIPKLQIVQPEGSLDGEAHFQISDPQQAKEIHWAEGKATVKATNLWLPKSLVPIPASLGGRHASGTIVAELRTERSIVDQEPHVRNFGKLDASAMQLGEVTMPKLDLQFDRTPERWEVQQFYVEIFNGQIEGKGTAPLVAGVKGPMELTWTDIRVADVVRRLPGSVALRAHSSGQVKGTAERAAIAGGPDWDVVASGSTRLVDVFWAQQRLASGITAEISFGDGRLNLDSLTANLPAGTASGTAELFIPGLGREDSVDSLRGKGNFQATNLPLPGLTLPRSNMSFSLAEDILTCKASAALFGGEGMLDGRFSIRPGNEASNLGGRLTVRDVSIGPWIRTLRLSNYWNSLNGRVGLVLNLPQNPDTLAISGSGPVETTSFTWGTTTLSNGMRGNAYFDGQRLSISDLSGDLAGGLARVTTTLDLDQLHRSRATLSFRQSRASTLLAFIPGLQPYVSGIAQGRAELTFQSNAALQGELLVTGGRLFDVPFTEWRAPIGGLFNVQNGSGILEIRGSRMQVCTGRATGDIRYRWGAGTELDCNASFAEVDVPHLLREATGDSMVNSGKARGTIWVGGRNIASFNDISAELDTRLSRVDAFNLPIISSMLPYLNTMPVQRSAVGTGQIRASLSRGIYRFTNSNLTVRTVAIGGSGTLNSTGRLNLEVLVQLRPIDLATGLIPPTLATAVQSTIGQKPIWFKVTGTMNNPHVRILAFRSVFDFGR